MLVLELRELLEESEAPAEFVIGMVVDIVRSSEHSLGLTKLPGGALCSVGVTAGSAPTSMATVYENKTSQKKPVEVQS